MFNKLFTGQGTTLKLAALAAVPFLALWMYFKLDPIRPSAIPVPAAVVVESSTWYNPLSWGRDQVIQQAANDSLLRSVAFTSQAREVDSAGLTEVLMTVALVAAGLAVLAKMLEVKIPHPQIDAAAKRAAEATATKFIPQLPAEEGSSKGQGSSKSYGKTGLVSHAVSS
jgi:hypothetical protein